MHKPAENDKGYVFFKVSALPMHTEKCKLATLLDDSLISSYQYKKHQYILPKIESLITNESDLTANLTNIAAVLKQAFGWLWVGFYLVDPHGRELILGPFQGPLVCTRIPKGRGVCGQAWAARQTVVVPDVNQHPDHIACATLSQSEVVVPLFDKKRQFLLILDADADEKNHFDAVDAHYLERLAELIGMRHGEGVTAEHSRLIRG